MLSILQRDARLLDFFMEDIAPYSDEQVGAAARKHARARERSAGTVCKVRPVVDGVEGTYVKAPSKDAAQVNSWATYRNASRWRNTSASRMARCNRGASTCESAAGCDRAGAGRNRSGITVPAQRYVIGIDLGTTNSALAYTELHAESEQIEVQPMLIPQLTNPGEVRDEALLPSSLYLPGSRDFPAGSISLPWENDPQVVVGKLAQETRSENTGRWCPQQSWLSHARDRTSAILPSMRPRAREDFPRRRFDEVICWHLHKAWNARLAMRHLSSRTVYERCRIVRCRGSGTTLRAAEQAGCPNITLLEEPQSAFYAWIEAARGLARTSRPGDLVLVVDIGGALRFHAHLGQGRQG